MSNKQFFVTLSIRLLSSYLFAQCNHDIFLNSPIYHICIHVMKIMVWRLHYYRHKFALSLKFECKKNNKFKATHRQIQTQILYYYTNNECILLVHQKLFNLIPNMPMVIYSQKMTSVTLTLDLFILKKLFYRATTTRF